MPQSFVDRLLKWAEGFDDIEKVTWPRFAGIENAVKVELYGCSDASSYAMGGCIYLVCTDGEGKITTNLVLGKTLNKPKKVNTIPRLELISAILLINIMKTVRTSFPEIRDEDIFWFTDSADVLFWLYSGHLSWKPFVANQIKKMRKCSLVQNWRHIDTSENPADLPSRGTKLCDLKENDFWKHGPKFWCNSFDLGKSCLEGYNKHYRDLEISPACKAAWTY